MVTARFSFPAPSSSSGEILWVTFQNIEISKLTNMGISKLMNCRKLKQMVLEISEQIDSGNIKTNYQEISEKIIRLPLAPSHAGPQSTCKHM